MDSELKVVRMHRFEGDTKLKAFVDVSIGDFIVKGLRVVNGEKGMFLSMPREKGKDGKWYDTLHPITQEARQSISDIVLEAYKE